METTVARNDDERRYEIRADGALAGFTAYHERPGLIAFMHTEVDEALEGQGLASKLIGDALDDARDRGLAVLPFCPFVNDFVVRHREYATLVPEQYRSQFGL